MFDQALTDLERGGSVAIEVVGEPGIGKTRLLSELGRTADARGQLVLSGSASELESDVPFWLFVDALDEYVHGLKPHRVAALADTTRAELATVFPSLSAPATHPEVALQHERYRSHRAVRELLERLADTQPLVLLLDDVHWADPASLELLGALLHRPPSAPVLIAVALRPRQVPDRLSVPIARAERAGTLARAEVAPLSWAEARELLSDSPDEVGAVLYDESGGNPFYLEQLARSLDRPAEPPSARITTVAEIEVPESVAAALAEELSLLSERARIVLQGAAVAGDPFEPELAAAAADVPDAAALEAMNELLQRDLVRSTDVPRQFRFRHPLLRRAVYESAPGGWRIAAHERSERALAALGASAAARAHHVEYSARTGDLAAVAVLREAGESAAHRAPASAERWFGAALRLLPDAAPAADRVELLLARSRSLAATGHFADSYAALLESLTIVPEESVGLRVQVTTACAVVENLLGRHKQARARLEDTLADIGDAESPDAIALMIELAVDALFSAEYEAMHAWALRAAEAAAPLEDRVLGAATLAVRAAGAALGGAVVNAQVYREQAAELVDRLSDNELSRRLDILFHLANAEVNLDHFEDVCRHTDRALRIGRATGQGDLFPILLPMLGTALWLQGRVAEATEVLDGAVEAARLVDNPHGLVWNLLNRSLAGFAAGDVDAALATGEEAVDVARHLDSSSASAWAAVALATALLGTDRAAPAAELLIASGGIDQQQIGGGWRVRSLELLTRCLLASGKREEAQRTASTAEDCADGISLPMAAAMADLARAAVMLDSGDSGHAAERALLAATALEEAGNLFDAAGARTLAGRALARAGEHARAATQLERSAAAFDGFGSPRLRAEAERELRKLGRRIHRRTRAGDADATGVASLTGRELEVARLVADGKTNAEIAATLYLSPKTVETHLRNTFRKLNVSSRLQVARAVEQSDHAGQTT
jgi:DNA-binding CsgD family transcriptional regulator